MARVVRPGGRAGALPRRQTPRGGPFPTPVRPPSVRSGGGSQRGALGRGAAQQRDAPGLVRVLRVPHGAGRAQRPGLCTPSGQCRVGVGGGPIPSRPPTCPRRRRSFGALSPGRVPPRGRRAVSSRGVVPGGLAAPFSPSVAAGSPWVPAGPPCGATLGKCAVGPNQRGRGPHSTRWARQRPTAKAMIAIAQTGSWGADAALPRPLPLETD